MSVQWPKVGFERDKWVIKKDKYCSGIYLFIFKDFSHFNSSKLQIRLIGFLLLF